MNSRQKHTLASLCPTVRWQVNMADFSSFRTGGTAEAFVETEDPAVLRPLLRWLTEEDIAWRALGGGSNILFASGTHEGVVVHLKGGRKDLCRRRSGEDDAAGRCLVDAPAGMKLGRLLAWCARQGLGGLEDMAGIPGTVGGAVFMNAGAFGRCMGDCLAAVRCLDARGETVELPASALSFQYRHTVFPPEYREKCLITGATLRLETSEEGVIRERMRTIVAQRRAKQPQGLPCAGSFFKNPPGDFAGRLIELCGLKGYCQGQAMVSPKHGNIIVNQGGASPEDIFRLMRIVQDRVIERCGIMLEPEVRLFGWYGLQAGES